MCGIVGIYSHEFSKEALEIHIDEMAKALAHRGPDDFGTTVLDLGTGGYCALGNLRLSIQDISPAGHQPMSTHDGSKWIVYNGEVYNFKKIRKELPARHRFTSETDTEVVLAAYDAWGLDCFKHFNGMWGLALLDLCENRLVLSRDRLGIKPLYYTWLGRTLIFASEIKAILTFKDVQRKLDRPALLDYLSYRYVLGERTLFQGIYSLLPGHHLVVQKDKTKLIQYWDLPVVTEKESLTEEEACARTDELFQQSIEYRMISDVPVGAYLSGGLDSSAVVASMAKASSFPIKTFTIGFEEAGYNEFSYADEVADFFATDHHKIMLKRETYWDLLHSVIRFKDAPLSVPNEVPLYVLSKELKKYITVVLSGEGADELFGGYGKIFRSAYDFQRIQRVQRNGFLDSAETKVFEENIRAKYGRFNLGTELEHFLSQYSYIPQKEKQELLNPDVFHSSDLLNSAYFDSSFERHGSLYFRGNEETYSTNS